MRMATKGDRVVVVEIILVAKSETERIMWREKSLPLLQWAGSIQLLVYSATVGRARILCWFGFEFWRMRAALEFVPTISQAVDFTGLSTLPFFLL